MARQTTPTNLSSKATGEVFSFPSRAAARAYTREHGGARAFRSSEYIQRITRMEAAHPGISRTEARGNSKDRVSTGEKPKFYQTPRTVPQVYQLSSGSDTRSLTDVRLLRRQFDKTKGEYIKISVRGLFPSGQERRGKRGKKQAQTDSPPVVPMDPNNPQLPRGMEWRPNQQWLGITMRRTQVSNIIATAEREAQQGIPPVQVFERFGWRIIQSPIKRVTAVAFEQMPGRRQP